MFICVKIFPDMQEKRRAVNMTLGHDKWHGFLMQMSDIVRHHQLCCPA